MKGIKVLIFVIALIFICQVAFASSMCAIIHTHTQCSDGIFLTIKRLVDITKRAGCQVLVITDHGDSLKQNGCYMNEVEEAKKYTKGGFFVFVGREITVGSNPKKSPDHMNAISYAPQSGDYLYDSHYSANEVETVLGILANESSKSYPAITYFNHPSFGKNKKWAEIAKRFDCIEVLNTLGGSINEGTNYKYDYDFQVYLKQGNCVIGGSDTHIEPQVDYGGVNRTFFYPEGNTYDGIFSALRRNTIAAKELLVKSINYPPRMKPYPVAGRANIEMTIELPPALFVGEILKANIYADNSLQKTIQIQRSIADLRKKFTISFSEDIEPGRDSCYIIEIKPYIITSPICFTSTKQQVSPSGRALRIKKASIDKNGVMDFLTDNDDLITSSFKSYIVCHEDYIIYAPGNVVADCQEPLFAMISDSNGKVSLIRNNSQACAEPMFNALGLDQDNYRACAESMGDSYVIKIDADEWRAIEYNFMTHQFLIANSGQSISGDEEFTVCNPGGTFSFNPRGDIEGCEASYNAKTGGKISGSSYYGLAIDSFAPVFTSNYFILIKK